jgi:ABC-type multidrug transport system fused ATPase/permease subunit
MQSCGARRREREQRCSSRPTLENVTLSLERGKRYALIGGSASGKSTLLRLLSGLYEAQRIIVDQSGGTAIMSAAEAARFLRTCATLIPQDADVFEGTLAENLGLCDRSAGAAALREVRDVLKLATVTDFLDHPSRVGKAHR